MTLEITNKGSLTAKNLTLNLPLSGTAIVVNKEEQEHITEFSKILSIGDIPIKDVCKVYIWTSYGHGLADHYFEFENGSGKIQFPFKI